MNAAPQNISDDLTDWYNVAIRSGRFVDKNSFEWKKIERLCSKLIEVNPVEGWCNYGIAHGITGNINEMERGCQAVFHLGPSMVQLRNIMSTYGNIGLFSKQLELFEKYANPEKGDFTNCAIFGFACGAFSTMKRFLGIAEKMNIDTSGLDTETIARASEILSHANVTDAHVASHMDLAGRILFNHKLFFLGAPEVSTTKIDDDYCGVTLVLRTLGSRGEVFALNTELAEAEEESGFIKNPAFDVLFLPAIEQAQVAA